MDRPNHKDVAFFTAIDVTTSPAQGLKTLFVVGVRSLDQVMTLAKEHNCRHVYFGANSSFQKNKAWAEIIPIVLAAGYKVTLDFPNSALEYVRDLLGPINALGHPSFIPTVAVSLPYVENINKNLMVKIDDSEYEKSNSGVWCITSHDLLDSNRFTAWNEFESDQILMTSKDIKNLRTKRKTKDAIPSVIQTKPKKEVEEPKTVSESTNDWISKNFGAEGK